MHQDFKNEMHKVKRKRQDNIPQENLVQEESKNEEEIPNVSRKRMRYNDEGLIENEQKLKDKHEQVVFDINAQIFVGNLSFKTSEHNLRRAFRDHGCPVTGCRIVMDAEKKHSLGYAFLDFPSVQDATHAVAVMKQKLVDDRPILVEFSNTTPQPRSHHKKIKRKINNANIEKHNQNTSQNKEKEIDTKVDQSQISDNKPKLNKKKLQQKIEVNETSQKDENQQQFS